MKTITLILAAGALMSCQNPDFRLGAVISSDGISPSVTASSDNLAVVVRP